MSSEGPPDETSLKPRADRPLRRPTFRPRRRVRRRRAGLASLALLLVFVALGVVLRTRWFSARVAAQVQRGVQAATGLDVSYADVGFNVWTFSVRVNRIEVRRPGTPRLVRIEALEVGVSPHDLLRGTVRPTTIAVDGAIVDLRFERQRGGVVLANGPVARGGGGGGKSELPFRDLALSDVRFSLVHPDVGSVTLDDVDIDVLNRPGSPLRLGVLVGGGELRTHWFNGPVQRVEARLAVGLGGADPDLDIAAASVTLGPSAPGAETAVQVRALRLKRHPDGHLRLDADARVATRVETVLHAIPHGPAIEGRVALDARAAVDLDAATFSAEATVDGERLGLFEHDSTTHQTIRYSLSDTVHVRCSATQETLRCSDFEASYAGARVRSERLTITDLLHRPAIAGRLRIDGLDFTKLMRDVTVTPRTKVLWTIAGDLELSGTLAPLRLEIGLRELDTRNFAVLRDYWQVQPQRPIVALPRARLTGRMFTDGTRMSWNDITATFGHSSIHARKVQIRLSHDSTHRERDFIIEGLHTPHLDLADLDTIADLPVRGEAELTVRVDDDLDDPLLQGSARFRNFAITGLPFGNLATSDKGWRLRGLRVDAPLMAAAFGETPYEVRDAYLDFNRWTLTAGATVHSERMRLVDFYRMFHFENDPTFVPFAGATAVNARIDYVLGRPGDDRDGVMSVEARTWQGALTAYGESFTDVEAQLGYDWLRRREGVRGAVVHLDRLFARKHTGSVEIAGTMEPGAHMHFVASAQNLPLDRLDRLAPRVEGGSRLATGRVSALVTAEGTPDAPRVNAVAQLSDLVVLDRPLGSVNAEITQTPTSTTIPTSGETEPPPTRIDLAFTALDERLRGRSTVETPWRRETWRDATGEAHRSWGRDWMASTASGSVVLTESMDLLPWLPASLLARLGEDRRARLRARVDVQRARFDAPHLAQAALRVDALDLHAYGVPLQFSPGAALEVRCCDGRCGVSDGRGQGGCPEAGATPVAFANESPLLLGPEGSRLWVGGVADINEKFEVASMNLATRGEADLERLAATLPGVVAARGNARLDVTVTGNQASPNYAGSITLGGGALRLASGYAPPLTEVDIDVRFDRDEVRFERFRALAGAGLVDLTGGFARLQGLGFERYAIPVRVQGLALAPLEGLNLTLDADLEVSGDSGGEPALARGDLNLRRVRYTRPIATSLDVLSGAGARAGASGANTERPYDPANDAVRFDIAVRTPAPMRVANNLVDADLVIGRDRDFRIVGTNQRWGLVGSLEVPRGTLRLYSNEFEVRRARIEFDDPERVEPVFDILAQTEVRRTGDSNRSQWRIALHGYGSTRSGLNLDMSAEPALSREDILFLLLFRATRAELERLGTNAGQAIGIEALWLLSGLDRRVTQAIPVIDEFRVGSTYNPRTNATEPQLSIGRGIGERLRVGGSVTASTQPLTRATLDLRVSQQAGVQVIGENVGNQLGTVSINIGADFRWRLEFQ